MNPLNTLSVSITCSFPNASSMLPLKKVEESCNYHPNACKESFSTGRLTSVF